ncbi:hydroxyethylthiazole kinase [Clostridium sp. HMP27]|uniref:hydroxyethylthiazole kinase n=1 Tax=Clostridium sp. HMP27 TaxID=1487921 RepID=UPI00052B8EFF|nr:hydroxyethylthiazole kinase [Clostridium sp. HMP27]KGK87640.1 hydroxyethylthiazole kinase [Clostridium sp. HMP27]
MGINEKLNRILLQVKEKTPLVHHITNYVTVNDCANIVLALGGSPVMADDEAEVEEMVSIASALVINIGTLNSRTINSMILAGKKANELNVPVILDPVGVGATSLRTKTAKLLLENIQFDVIRGNLSEIKVLAGLSSKTRGVDVDVEEKDEIEGRKKLGEELSKKLNSVIAITGKVDSISYNDKTYLIYNGHPMLSQVTGTGCMCSSLIGAFLGTGEDKHIATVLGVLTMGISGERAYKAVTDKDLGTGSFRTAIIDSVSNITPEIIYEYAKITEK